MKDGLGRRIDYLRISLTDKCNLRCLYCMPKDGIVKVNHEELLRFDEIVRIVSLATKIGLQKVRLTGGEPLVRREVPSLVRMLKAACPQLTIAMTSNGIMLSDHVRELKEAGLSEINVSLDTLHPETFRKLTGEDAIEKTLAGISAAREAGLKVKLNCVPIAGINDKELLGLVEYSINQHLVIRFIELMPIGCGMQYQGVPFDRFMKELEATYGKVTPVFEDNETEPHGPAVYYRLGRDLGKIGLIRPITSCFCEKCNRVRLTADGNLKLCLYHPDCIPLRDALRSGMSDEELIVMLETAIARKPKEHHFGSFEKSQDERRMFEIGG